MDISTAYQLASISDLQRDYLSLLDKVKKLARPLLLLKHNKPEAVLVSVKEYEDLAKKRRLYEEGMILKEITYFEKEKKAGRLKVAYKAEDLFK